MPQGQRRAKPRGTGRPTIKDVAALASVDPSAVSRVINNDPRLSIADTTRARILAAIETLQYRPNMVARGLRLSRTWTIGLLLPDLDNPIYHQIISGARVRASKNAYGLVLGDENSDKSSDQRAGALSQMLGQRHVDGLLVASGSLTDSIIRSISESDSAPVVMVNRRVPGIQSSVTVDDAGGSETATRLLLDHGHERVAGIFGPLDVDTSARRHEGFARAFDRTGAKPAVVASAGWGLWDGYQAALGLLSTHRDITAVFASTVFAGLGVLRAAHELGIAVPDDLSVVTLHDSNILDYVRPSLTTIAMPTTEMGESAVDLLLRLLDGGQPQALVIPGAGRVIDRGSVVQR